MKDLAAAPVGAQPAPMPEGVPGLPGQLKAPLRRFTTMPAHGARTAIRGGRLPVLPVLRMDSAIRHAAGDPGIHDIAVRPAGPPLLHDPAVLPGLRQPEALGLRAERARAEAVLPPADQDTTNPVPPFASTKRPS